MTFTTNDHEELIERAIAAGNVAATKNAHAHGVPCREVRLNLYSSQEQWIGLEMADYDPAIIERKAKIIDNSGMILEEWEGDQTFPDAIGVFLTLAYGLKDDQTIVTRSWSGLELSAGETVTKELRRAWWLGYLRAYTEGRDRAINGSDRNWRQIDGDPSAQDATFARVASYDDEDDKTSIEMVVIRDLACGGWTAYDDENRHEAYRLQRPFMVTSGYLDITRQEDDLLRHISSGDDIDRLLTDQWSQALAIESYQGLGSEDRSYETLREAMDAYDIPASALNNPKSYSNDLVSYGDYCPICERGLFPPVSHARDHVQFLFNAITPITDPDSPISFFDYSNSVLLLSMSLDTENEIDQTDRALLVMIDMMAMELLRAELSALLDKRIAVWWNRDQATEIAARYARKYSNYPLDRYTGSFGFRGDDLDMIDRYFADQIHYEEPASYGGYTYTQTFHYDEYPRGVFYPRFMQYRTAIIARLDGKAVTLDTAHEIVIG